MPDFSGFDQRGFDFLQGLEADNNKAYFDAHRPDFDEGLMAPARAFVVAVGDRLHRDYSAGILAEPKVNRAIRRMPRDTRFSNDKTPYKTHLDLWFQHGQGRTHGFFFRLFHDRVCIGGGTHGFDKPTLAAYREAVADPSRPEALTFEQNVEYRTFVLTGQIGGVLRQLLQRLLLAGDAEVGEDTVNGQQIGYFH